MRERGFAIRKEDYGGSEEKGPTTSQWVRSLLH